MNEIENSKENTAEKEDTYEYEDIIERYLYFDKYFDPLKNRIYYPCCAGDISPSKAFPQSEVIYVEKEEKRVETLRKQNFNVHKANAEEFNPQDIDILIMLSPEINPKKPSSHVINNGFVLCNNHTFTADYLQKGTNFKLHGVLKKENGDIIFDKENLEKYFTKPREKRAIPRDIFIFQKTEATNSLKNST